MITKTEIHKGFVGKKRGWAFSIYFNDKEFVPNNEDIEVVTPYEKDGEMRAKFTTRHGDKGRLVIDTVI